MAACDSLICKPGDYNLGIIYPRCIYKCLKSVLKEQLVNSMSTRTDT